MIALVPAHNEAAGIEAAVRSLFAQTMPPDRVLVIADNCTDDTAALAAAAGAEVFTTTGNTAKKAGALNQAWDAVEPGLGWSERVLVMDADSALHEGFLAAADAALRARPDVGGVGGTFLGVEDGTLVGWFQRNEFARYRRDVQMLRGRSLVLTGTASVFPAHVLREIARAREDGTLPGLGQVEKFWSKVKITDECWEWSGRVNRDGYGSFDLPRPGHNRSVLTHRFSYELAYGRLPRERQVLHRCDNPRCVRPDHLFEGNHAANMRDMVEKGRKPSRNGELNGRAKLTLDQVREIRAKYHEDGGYGRKAALAREYGVTTTTVSQILVGNSWREEVVPSVGLYDVRVLTED